MSENNRREPGVASCELVLLSPRRISRECVLFYAQCRTQTNTPSPATIPVTLSRSTNLVPPTDSRRYDDALPTFPTLLLSSAQDPPQTYPEAIFYFSQTTYASNPKLPKLHPLMVDTTSCRVPLMIESSVLFKLIWSRMGGYTNFTKDSAKSSKRHLLSIHPCSHSHLVFLTSLFSSNKKSPHAQQRTSEGKTVGTNGTSSLAPAPGTASSKHSIMPF